MAELIISVSGLRGIVGETLTPEVAIRYVRAFAAGLDEGPIVVTRDGRANGPQLADAVTSGLISTGRDVLDAGVAATPTTGILVREFSAAGGLQISASHNPAEYNGLKLVGSDGRVVPAEVGQRVLERYQGQQPKPEPAKDSGRATQCVDTTTAHWEKIRPLVDVARIRAARFKVLLDANHGSGSILGRKVLEELGCDTVLLGEQPDGIFDHPPEPTADNLAGVRAEVTASSAAIGFCQDPDADRLAVIDQQGRYLGEEYTLAMCVHHVLRGGKGPVVTNCSTSRMSQDIAERFGVAFFYTAVGEANVADQMLQVGAVIGGEGNGGVIDPRVGYVRDSFVGMALLLDAMAGRNLPVSALADELPRYVMAKKKTPLDRQKLTAALAAIKRHFADAKASELDGLRLDWPDRWLLIRASNTEPIVRLMSEAATEQAAEDLCRQAEAVINSQQATE